MVIQSISIGYPWMFNGYQLISNGYPWMPMDTHWMPIVYPLISNGYPLDIHWIWRTFRGFAELWYDLRGAAMPGGARARRRTLVAFIVNFGRSPGF